MQPQAEHAEAAPRGGAAAAPETVNRLVGTVLLAASLAVLLVAAWLEPSSAGLGTHRQLGMTPCGFLTTTGLPCATCGMSTAFAHAADGNLVAAAVTQPAGAVLAVLTAVTAILGGYAAATGASLAPVGRWAWRPAPLIVLGLLVLGSWAYKAWVVYGGQG